MTNDMSSGDSGNIIVFGAGGRVGRAAVAEAVARGHRVTAVVRDPAKYGDLAGSSVTLVRGDVTDPASVAALAAGHDAAVNASVRLDVSSEEYFTAAAKALVAGLGEAGVRRLLTLGIATTLESEPGVRLMDAPEFPAEWRAFSQGHVAEFALLSAEAGPELDWLMVVPPMDLNAEAEVTGGYRTAVGTVIEGPGRIAHRDLALALLDEIERPRHSRVQLAVSVQDAPEKPSGRTPAP
ncbi:MULTISPECIES: NAD(P)H-binding protein [unclassified Streptomyces]|uniref:NAD(P)-dependent oxidoreductase n=1 Tax=unclassified Streptomyces TaxID=2593676 RepID=UPI0006FA4D9C|nr:MULTISPECIES: NAD(P)H-binding protein [unclassified Streptomyces]KQX57040.1 NmrA family transcriptional regulator [Streptomyces sp. Root1304]KRA98621.1 NmrA family transcriptional regulator [Streptomyces sp. Root66D1]